MINKEKKTMELWELYVLVPAAKSVKKICDLFELPLEYFGEYYTMYFRNPEESFVEWKNRNGYSYSDYVMILEFSRSDLLTFVREDYGISYDMYLKIKKVGILF
ncbi:MAG TPA: XRE family transcriptional regulator [Clostridium sp.]